MKGEKWLETFRGRRTRGFERMYSYELWLGLNVTSNPFPPGNASFLVRV